MKNLEQNSLYEITTKIDQAPCSLDAQILLLRLLEEHGTQEVRNGEIVWLDDTVQIIDRVRQIVDYIVTDSECFKYQLPNDWKGAQEGIVWIRANLGLLLP